VQPAFDWGGGQCPFSRDLDSKPVNVVLVMH